MNCRHNWFKKSKKISDKLETEHQEDVSELAEALDKSFLEEEKKPETTAA